MEKNCYGWDPEVIGSNSGWIKTQEEGFVVFYALPNPSLLQTKALFKPDST